MTSPIKPRPSLDIPPYLKKAGVTYGVRHPATGQYLTEGLFYEFSTPSSVRPVYTLQREDLPDPRSPGRTIYSFQREYLTLMDPTGYKASQYLVAGWQHWLRLLNNKQFKKSLDLWNDEIVAQLKALGYETYVKAARAGDLKAADWLMKQTVPQVEAPAKRPVGRPEKTKPQSGPTDEELAKDMERIRNAS